MLAPRLPYNFPSRTSPETGFVRVIGSEARHKSGVGSRRDKFVKRHTALLYRCPRSVAPSRCESFPTYHKVVNCFSGHEFGCHE